MNTKPLKLSDKANGRIKQFTATENLFFQLRKDIINNQWLLPSWLQTETEQIACHLRCRKQPPAGTLSRLAAIGLVRQEIQRGFNVAPASVEDLRDIGEVSLAKSI